MAQKFTINLQTHYFSLCIVVVVLLQGIFFPVRFVLLSNVKVSVDVRSFFVLCRFTLCHYIQFTITFSNWTRDENALKVI